MAGSLEDLRDLYKSNKKSREKYPVGGATSRYANLGAVSKSPGNYLLRRDTTSRARTDTDLNRINEYYCITEDQVTYSLDKKKRWQIKSDLVNKMADFKLEGSDVKLIETAPIGNMAANGPKVIAYHKSKGERSNPSQKNGNFKSLLAQERIEKARQTRGQTIQVKKPNRFKPVDRFQKSNRSSGSHIEHIVIQSEESGDSEDEGQGYGGTSQYVIGYEPNKQELKKTKKYGHFIGFDFNNRDSKSESGIRRNNNNSTKAYLSGLDEPMEAGSDESESADSDSQVPSGGVLVDLEQLANYTTKTIEFEELVNIEIITLCYILTRY
jgi:hypothetical protein